MTRHWHIEHGDGRPWTRDELDGQVALDCAGRRPPLPKWWLTLIDEASCPVLVDTRVEWHDVKEGEDMVVVWDG